jgi:hypothetical protein
MWGDAKLWAVLETGGNGEGPMATTIGAVQSLLPGACSLAWTRDRVASSPMKPTRWVRLLIWAALFKWPDPNQRSKFLFH